MNTPNSSLENCSGSCGIAAGCVTCLRAMIEIRQAKLARFAERQAKTAELARFDARFPRIRELVKQDLIVSNETGSSAHVDTDHQPATHKLMKVPEIEID